ncbi:MAG: ATP-binding protein [Candidatus Margulisiibacteriota bacterium]
MKNEEEKKIEAYIKVKWWIIGLTFFGVLTELITGLMGWMPVLLIFIVLFAASLSNLLAAFLSRRKQLISIHYFLFSDLLFIISALYLTGGLENSWSFLLGVLIFVVGYQISFRASLFYMALSLFSLTLMFSLEYFRLIPHFEVYNMPELYWTNTRYFVDYLFGLIVFYGIAAVSSGVLNQAISRSNKEKDARINEENNIRKDLEASRRALLNVVEDLDRSKGELEKRVKERTAQLEDAKKNLEEKVKKRTEDLEFSRKAILHMMQDLKQDVEKLKTVDRMKTEFLTVVSHELKTPLTPVLEYASLLKEGVLGPVNKDQLKALEGIYRQSIHLKDLIENILDVSRIETGKQNSMKIEPISFVNIIDEVEEAVLLDVKKMGLTFEKDLGANLPVFYADENSFRRVMINLVGNAIKFTPRGGRIKVSAAEKGGSLEICVSDTGIGLSKENLERIFDKFYQVDASLARGAPGMGMGLAICKGVVESHGGRIWAESEGIGKGTRICMLLPLGEKD